MLDLWRSWIGMHRVNPVALRSSEQVAERGRAVCCRINEGGRT
jgi:hypothetical protein